MVISGRGEHTKRRPRLTSRTGRVRVAHLPISPGEAQPWQTGGGYTHPLWRCRHWASGSDAIRSRATPGRVIPPVEVDGRAPGWTQLGREPAAGTVATLLARVGGDDEVVCHGATTSRATECTRAQFCRSVSAS